MTHALLAKLRHDLTTFAVVGAASLAAAGGAVAQTYTSGQASAYEEGGGLTVYGDPRHAHSLSGVVSFRDLDLRTHWGVRELWRRIKFTALSLCEQLGEPRYEGSGLPSCRNSAIARARPDVQRAVNSARGLG